MDNETGNWISSLDKLADKLAKVEKDTYTDGFNFFSAVGMTTQEVRHSTFLAWLLNPNMQHGLNDKALRLFCEELCKYKIKNKNINLPSDFKENSEILKDIGIVDAAELLALLAGEINVTTEEVVEGTQRRTDIIINCVSSKTVIIIENKILTESHDDQLHVYEKKYSSYGKRIFVYLSPRGDLPINKGGDEKYNNKWCIFDYEEIRNMADRLLKSNACQNNIKLKLIIEDYIEMIDTNILESNPTVLNACKEIYSKHKQAIELLIRYINSTVEKILIYARGELSCAIPDIVFSNDRNPTGALYFVTPNILQKFGKGCRCVCGSLDGGESICAYIEFLKSSDAPWTDNQLKFLEKYEPKKIKKNQYARVIKKIHISPKTDRGRNFDKIQVELDKKLKQFISEVKNFETKIQNL